MIIIKFFRIYFWTQCFLDLFLNQTKESIEDKKSLLAMLFSATQL